MHRYVHEAIYLYCKTHGPLVRGSELWVGPIWPHNKNVSNLIIVCCTSQF